MSTRPEIQTEGDGHGVTDEYDPDHRMPLGSYVVLGSGYVTAVVTSAVLLRRSGRGLPPRIPFRDIALIGVATFKLSRLLTRERITAPLRAPFAKRRQKGKGAELIDTPRGSGLQRAVGELMTCPFCISQWVGSSLTMGYVLAPDATRIVTGSLTAVTVADFLQYAHSAAQNKAG